MKTGSKLDRITNAILVSYDTTIAYSFKENRTRKTLLEPRNFVSLWYFFQDYARMFFWRSLLKS